MEAAKQPPGATYWCQTFGAGSQGVQAGPDALLATFIEVYLHFGFQWPLHHAALHQLLEPITAAGAGGAGGAGSASGGRMRLRDANFVVTLPARTLGNLPGVVVEAVEQPLGQLVEGYYGLLTGQTEPDPMQQSVLAVAAADTLLTLAWDDAMDDSGGGGSDAHDNDDVGGGDGDGDGDGNRDRDDGNGVGHPVPAAGTGYSSTFPLAPEPCWGIALID